MSEIRQLSRKQKIDFVVTVWLCSDEVGGTGEDFLDINEVAIKALKVELTVDILSDKPISMLAWFWRLERALSKMENLPEFCE